MEILVNSRSAGCSEVSSVFGMVPMTNVPAGIITISGQSEQSRMISLGFGAAHAVMLPVAIIIASGIARLFILSRITPILIINWLLRNMVYHLH